MAANNLYPLTFRPIPVAKIWGGDKLTAMFDKEINTPMCGEIWEIATVPGHISQVKNGELAGALLTDLIEQYKGDLVGKSVYERFGAEFPLLVKFIDAQQNLSIQVHPNDRQAASKNSLGKSELWYILQADEGAELITGFDKPLSKEEFVSFIKNHAIEDVLHHEQVSAGDVYYTPAGRIHNIGAGMVIAEIQQSSDITYRIYDYDREDIGGGKRALHIDEAVEVLDFDVIDNGKTAYRPAKNEAVNLVVSPHFVVNRLVLDSVLTRDYSEIDSFMILMCIEGGVTAQAGDHTFELSAGEVYLLPAVFKQLSLVPKGEAILLESYV